MSPSDTLPRASQHGRSTSGDPPVVLFVGDLNARCRSYQRYLAARRVAGRVIAISFAPLFGRDQDGPPPTLLDRAASRLGFPRDTTNINTRILDALRSARFDVLWIDKAPALQPRTLDRARRIQPNLRIAFHSDDDMASRHNASTYFRRCLPGFDVVFTPKSFNADPHELPRQGARRVIYQPQAFDPEFHRPLPVTDADRDRLGAAVGFIGTFEGPRAQSMMVLARAGIPVRVFGNGWDHLRGAHDNLLVEGRPIYGADYIRALCTTDINLGFLRQRNRDLHTSRSLDIPACGAFLLAERTHEHEALFPEGHAADYFRSDDELLGKVRAHLADPSDRKRMAAAARARCLDKDMTHDAAMARMLSLVRRSTGETSSGSSPRGDVRAGEIERADIDPADTDPADADPADTERDEATLAS